MNPSQCRICGSYLEEDGSCKLCKAQSEAEYYLQEYEENVLTWTLDTQTASMRGFEFVTTGWQPDWEFWCDCPICMGEPNRDPIFKFREEKKYYDYEEW